MGYIWFYMKASADAFDFLLLGGIRVDGSGLSLFIFWDSFLPYYFHWHKGGVGWAKYQAFKPGEF